MKQKKYREKSSSFLIESRKLVGEAISSKADIDFIILKEGCDFESSLPSLYFEESLFNKFSNLTSPDGVAALVRKKPPKAISSPRVLLLDKINDPGNMGTIIRSAEAFGFFDIILSPDTVDIYNTKSLRASMGSVFRENILAMTYEEIRELKATYTILASDMAGLDVNKYNIGKDNLILAIGNEANGLSDEVRSMTDTFIKIPMRGEIESLNAAIAASIMMNRLGL
ncbi:RNA methyltransferase [Anaerococcus sp. AGMB09787]|uniref:TrmH family RNA methyltransferase n=1 Tax=Anaerococcus sp. AGMB09787 TaxID=2922869 RepID=UPI001FB01F28|nr:RNA methyltransferase [Anaerococcus sp. AGMB09787]